MLILAFDTTSEWGGAGIFRDKECLGSAAHNGPANYSVSLFQEVERLLKESGRNLEQIDLFAAAKGPGSFTGIRVGWPRRRDGQTRLANPCAASRFSRRWWSRRNRKRITRFPFSMRAAENFTLGFSAQICEVFRPMAENPKKRLALDSILQGRGL